MFVAFKPLESVVVIHSVFLFVKDNFGDQFYST